MYKKIPTAITSRKVKPIFTDVSYLGLMNNPEYENFFRAFCDDKCEIKYARLNRNLFRQFLQDRYSKVVGEKILIFLENQFSPLYRIDFKGFCSIIMEFINYGPEIY